MEGSRRRRRRGGRRDLATYDTVLVAGLEEFGTPTCGLLLLVVRFCVDEAEEEGVAVVDVCQNGQKPNSFLSEFDLLCQSAIAMADRNS